MNQMNISVEDVSVQETARLLKENKIRLLDVRTPQEYAIAKIAGAELVTDEAVPKILNLPKDTPIVVHCHHGMRSLQATGYLKAQGFTNVRNMAGGIDAWSAEIDPSVPRY
jgi:monothiol glutaredoxin